ncbi:MAG: biotin/lipoyl-binding protein [Calditrichaeota bacterium]|nr:biotin/lipoyl-binding protein [Calditrichota bacterium]
MNYISRIRNRNYRITLSETVSGEIIAEINGKKIPVTIQRKNGDGVCLAQVGNQFFEIDMTKNDTDYLLHYRGEITRVSVEDEYLSQFKKFTNHASKQQMQKELTAPMPGLVVTIEAKAGQQVRQGDGLIVFEAMKMENELKAPFDATIKEIKVSEKQAVDKDQLLIVFN